MRCLIVGQAKTGTTALSSLISEALGKSVGYFEDPIASIPELPPAAVVKVILDHEAVGPLVSFAANFDRRIALVRDPRDRMVSALLFLVATNRKFLEDDDLIEEFIKKIEEKQQNPRNTDLHRLIATWDSVFPNFAEKCAESTLKYADFLDTLDDEWRILRYEDVVAGDFAALSRHLDIPLAQTALVGAETSFVSRTRVAGDWRNWFTLADVGTYQPLLDPLLARLGYPCDWRLAAIPAIRPEHGREFLIRTIQRGRAYFGLPAISERPRIKGAGLLPTTPQSGLELFQEEVELSRAADVPVHLWWRDDDLVANSANFETLVSVAMTFAAPVLVAVIPGLVSDLLDVHDTDRSLVHFCQHGWKHSNHEPPGIAKSEFGSGRDASAVTAEIAAGQTTLARLLGERRLPIFVPPWNAIDKRHLEILQARGFTGLSVHGPRTQSFAVDGVRLANTHIDILRWDMPGQPKALTVEDTFQRLAQIVRQQRQMRPSDPEPIGLLSHHRAMGSDAWALIETIFSAVGNVRGISWVSPTQVFASPKLAG